MAYDRAVALDSLTKTLGRVTLINSKLRQILYSEPGATFETGLREIDTELRAASTAATALVTAIDA